MFGSFFISQNSFETKPMKLQSAFVFRLLFSLVTKQTYRSVSLQLSNNGKRQIIFNMTPAKHQCVDPAMGATRSVWMALMLRLDFRSRRDLRRGFHNWAVGRTVNLFLRTNSRSFLKSPFVRLQYLLSFWSLTFQFSQTAQRSLGRKYWERFQFSNWLLQARLVN